MKNSTKYLTISIAAFLCYCNTLWGTFVFDDSEAIVKNKDIRSYTPISQIFKDDFWGMDITLNSSHKSYRPLTILSYRLNVLHSNKLDAFQFHATNIILYGILCLLSVPIFELFLKKKINTNNIDNLAYLSSLLYTVHPIHTEAVAGLVGRADILCSIFFFIVIILYHKAVNKKSFLFLLFSEIFTGIAVLCKETAITVLGVCIIYDIFLIKKQRHSWSKLLSKNFLIRFTMLITWGLIILFFRFKIMNFEGPTFTAIDNPAAYQNNFLKRILSLHYIYFLNFLLLLWPEWLCFDWSMGCIPLIDNYYDKRLIIILIFWIFIIFTIRNLLGTILRNNILDYRIMGISLIILPFLPASNIFFKVGFVIAERNLLLSSAGYCFLIVIGLKKLLDNFPKFKLIITLLFHFTCFIFILRTIERNKNWLNEEKLYNSAINVCPLNAKVHYNIAKIAADKNNKTLAINEYRKAIELNPYYEQAMNNLANILREDKQFKEAEILLRKSLKIRPNFAAAWMNLGIVLTNLNQPNEAEICYKTAINYRNKYPDCYYNLGNLYLDLKRNEDALECWKKAVYYKPTHVAAWSNTLVLLDNLRQYTDVLNLGKIALAHNPDAPSLYFSIANTLGKLKEYSKAEKYYIQALNYSPDNALYYSNLGVLYHRWKKLDKAREMYEKALLIDPNMKTTEKNLNKLHQII